MFKRINQQLQAHREMARARRDSIQLLKLDDFILRDIGMSRHEIHSRMAR